MLICFDRYVTDGQTDRLTDGRTDRGTSRIAMSIPRVGVLTRDKNCYFKPIFRLISDTIQRIAIATMEDE